jgi:hypothetical protein
LVSHREDTSRRSLEFAAVEVFASSTNDAEASTIASESSFSIAFFIIQSNYLPDYLYAATAFLLNRIFVVRNRLVLDMRFFDEADKAAK